MLNNISLEVLAKKGYLVIPNDCTASSEFKEKFIGGIINSFNSLGYTLDKEGIIALSSLTLDELKSFYNENYSLLRHLTGMAVKHTIFYRNFPCMEKVSEMEYIIRAVLHYLTNDTTEEGFMNDDISDFEREIVHNTKYKMLKVITVDSAIKLLVELTKDLFEGKTAIPYFYNPFLELIFKDYRELIIISEIPFKENIAKYVSFIIDRNKDEKLGDVLSINSLRFVKTPTDLLRVYAIISNGDYTLRDNTKFISLDRKCRRLFLNVLSNMAINEYSLIEDFARHEFLWKRALEKLHVGEFANKFPLLCKICGKFRNGEYTTFYAELEEAKNDQIKYISLLMKRPGEFARRLDYLIRNDNFDLSYTLDSFKMIAYKISTSVLLQMWELFKNRSLYPTRIFKINRRYDVLYKEVLDQRKEISLDVINQVLEIITQTLKDIYSDYPLVDKVYIDKESLKGYSLPINSRNASCQNKTLTFGTRIKLEANDNNFLRFFTHFRNMPEGKEYPRVDIDLAIEFVDETFTKTFSLSWHNMSGGKRFNSYHSGDIVNAPNGASEFVDLDYVAARKYARYAIVTNSVYTGQDFADIPECFSGVMFMNQMGKKGEVFNPEFIEYKFDLTQRGSNENVAFAVDLETLELIWIDSPLYYSYSGIVASYSTGVMLALKNALKEHMNMYDFFKLHSEHMNIVDNIEEAEVIISDNDNATLKPFDVESISANWL